jgi:hypothetical protein
MIERTNRGLIEMNSTKMQSIVICEPQEKNLGNKIFGGWLMHEAYKLGIFLFLCSGLLSVFSFKYGIMKTNTVYSIIIQDN